MSFVCYFIYIQLYVYRQKTQMNLKHSLVKVFLLGNQSNKIIGLFIFIQLHVFVKVSIYICN